MNYKVDLTNAKKLNNKNLGEVVTDTLNDRQITSKKARQRFLHPNLKLIAHDIKLSQSNQIHDMKKGTDLIRYAIKHNWKITIYSDFDVDGITSNTIMYSMLKKLGAKHVDPFIPNRRKDGYGPNIKEYKRIAKNGTKLLITTDNGIGGYKEVNYMRKHNVDVIITDHHEWKRNQDDSLSKSRIPKANAIIMPNCPFDKFHFDGFCGAGIAFMIASYMFGRIATEYLDLACLATIADHVPMTNEDRVLVHFGLKQIHDGKRTGIRALAHCGHFKLSNLSANDLSFSLIPRLNSLGRMSDANIARTLLLK